MKRIALCLVSASIACTTNCHAQSDSLSASSPTTDTGTLFNHRLEACKVETNEGKRLVCFEQLSKDAVVELNQSFRASARHSESTANEGQYASFADLAKASLTANFKDPQSVQWRNLFVSGVDIEALCGELNAKNSYGAYVGFQRFLSVPSQQLHMTDRQDSASVYRLFVSQWETYCTKPVARLR